MRLECSSRGDRRFSSLYAYVDVFGKRDSIENHYQLSKVFVKWGEVYIPNDFKESKSLQRKSGYNLVGFQINGAFFELKYLSVWYKTLWCLYLKANPSLVDYASKFDTFTDCFKGKNTINCQADVIAQVVKDGLDSLEEECIPFAELVVKRIKERNGL